MAANGHSRVTTVALPCAWHAFAGPCVIGRTPGLVCRTPGLAFKHFRRVFLVRCPFTLSTPNSPSCSRTARPPRKPTPDAVLLECRARPRMVSLLHIISFVSGLHFSSPFVHPGLSSLLARVHLHSFSRTLFSQRHSSLPCNAERRTRTVRCL